MNVYVYKCLNLIELIMDDIINIVFLFENCLYFDIGNNKVLFRKICIVWN